MTILILLTGAAGNVHGLFRQCMESEFDRLVCANDSRSALLTVETGRQLRQSRADRSVARSGTTKLMVDAMQRSRTLLGEAAAKLDQPNRSDDAHSDSSAYECGGEGIPQVDGGESPPSRKRTKHADSRGRDRGKDKQNRGKEGKKRAEDLPAWKPKSQPKKVYHPISVNDPKFSDYVAMVVEAVNDEVRLKELNPDSFDAAEILKVSNRTYIYQPSVVVPYHNREC